MAAVNVHRLILIPHMCENIPQDFDRATFVEVLYWHVFDPLAQH